MASKNNPKNRSITHRETYCYHTGGIITPTKYVGSQVGHGVYIAAKNEKEKLVCDETGKPIPWKALRELSSMAEKRQIEERRLQHALEKRIHSIIMLAKLGFLPIRIYV